MHNRLALSIFNTRITIPVKESSMLKRYLAATSPSAGQKASVAYRIRLLLLNRWNLWKRLMRYRHWKGSRGERIDGTNNAAERAIGWWVKERYFG
jgi:hypothetical protein